MMLKIKKFIWKLQNFILDSLQVKCKHYDHWVKADILEGDYEGLNIHWCERCGSHQIVIQGSYVGEWIRPQPRWQIW